MTTETDAKVFKTAPNIAEGSSSFQTFGINLDEETFAGE